MRPTLSPRDWNVVRDNYVASQPLGHVVLDNFLDEEYYQSIRSALLDDGGWHQKNWQVTQLFNKQPPLPRLDELIAETISNLGSLAAGLELVKHWAVVCHQNEGLHVHADNAAIAVNIWLTPDEYNEDRSTGGLVLYDLRRSSEMQVHEFNAMPWAGDFFTQSGVTAKQAIGYKNNRAVIFDAALFHASDDIRFKTESMETLRMGLTLALDDPQDYSLRMNLYKSTSSE